MAQLRDGRWQDQDLGKQRWRPSCKVPSTVGYESEDFTEKALRVLVAAGASRQVVAATTVALWRLNREASSCDDQASSAGAGPPIVARDCSFDGEVKARMQPIEVAVRAQLAASRCSGVNHHSSAGLLKPAEQVRAAVAKHVFTNEVPFDELNMQDVRHLQRGSRRPKLSSALLGPSAAPCMMFVGTEEQLLRIASGMLAPIGAGGGGPIPSPSSADPGCSGAQEINGPRKAEADEVVDGVGVQNIEAVRPRQEAFSGDQEEDLATLLLKLELLEYKIEGLQATCLSEETMDKECQAEEEGEKSICFDAVAPFPACGIQGFAVSGGEPIVGDGGGCAGDADDEEPVGQKVAAARNLSAEAAAEQAFAGALVVESAGDSGEERAGECGTGSGPGSGDSASDEEEFHPEYIEAYAALWGRLTAAGRLKLEARYTKPW